MKVLAEKLAVLNKGVLLMKEGRNRAEFWQGYGGTTLSISGHAVQLELLKNCPQRSRITERSELQSGCLIWPELLRIYPHLASAIEFISVSALWKGSFQWWVKFDAENGKSLHKSTAVAL